MTQPNMKRRTLLQAMMSGLAVPPLFAYAVAVPVLMVYKSANCGCCTEWIRHLQRNGFTVKAQDVGNPSAYRKKIGIPDTLGSCHTALVQDYAIEGHVPASEIRRLLAERPEAIGLGVPAMPLGSPGMDDPRNDPYDVLFVQASGSYSTYRHYGAQ